MKPNCVIAASIWLGVTATSLTGTLPAENFVQPSVSVTNTLNSTSQVNLLVSSLFPPPIKLFSESTPLWLRRVNQSRSFEILPWPRFAPFQLIVVACTCKHYHHKKTVLTETPIDAEKKETVFYEPEGAFWSKSRNVLKIQIMKPQDKDVYFNVNWFSIPSNHMSLIQKGCKCIQGILYGIALEYILVRLELVNLRTHWPPSPNLLKFKNFAMVDVAVSPKDLPTGEHTFSSINDITSVLKFECGGDGRDWFTTWGITNNILHHSNNAVEVSRLTVSPELTDEPFVSDPPETSWGVESTKELFLPLTEGNVVFSPLFDLTDMNELPKTSRVGQWIPKSKFNVIFCLKVILKKPALRINENDNAGNGLEKVYLKTWEGWVDGETLPRLIYIGNDHLYKETPLKNSVGNSNSLNDTSINSRESLQELGVFICVTIVLATTLMIMIVVILVKRVKKNEGQLFGLTKVNCLL